MRAVVVTEYGGPEVLHVAESAQPAASAGRVRVRVHAAAVNPADTLIRSGALADYVDDSVPRPLRPRDGFSGCGGRRR